MARARPGLAKAINEILECRGTDGKRLSFRQAERLTGLAPATISELAKGNARTPETVRRFASGTNEDVTRLLLLAGFVPDEEMDAPPIASTQMAAPNQSPANGHALYPEWVAGGESTEGRRPAPLFLERLDEVRIDPEEQEWLGRMGRALAMLPPGRERQLWKENLRRDTELIESFLERLVTERPGHD